MTTYIKYRVYCVTEQLDKEWIVSSTDPVPTTVLTKYGSYY